jgi:ABC-2 type transport system permease protein
MMGLDTMRVRAVVRKELRDFRRKRSIVVTMCILPLLFLVEPVITIFLVTPSTSGAVLQRSLILPILYLLLIPTIMPSTLSAYSVVGEREQGTLEPLLTTPIREQEFLLGKATSVMIPTLVLSYAVFALFLGAAWLFANSAIASAVFHDSPVILALFLLAPLLAGWGIVVGMGVSVRASEARVAQQLAMLASFPPVGVIILLAVGVVRPTFLVALAFAAGLLVVDVVLLRFVSRMFDRERLVTGAKAVTR